MTSSYSIPEGFAVVVEDLDRRPAGADEGGNQHLAVADWKTQGRVL